MEGSEQECMACKQPISTEFIFMHTPKVFRKEYMKMIELDAARERALLKAPKERIEAHKRCRMLKSRINALSSHMVKYEDDEEMAELIKECIKEKCKLDNILERKDEENNKSTAFFCPLNVCDGIVYNGRCGDCRKAICAKCREERLDGHECNQQQLETIKLLKRDTKPCPGCKTPIYKIDGCDQMFCTKCKTAFSWRTLNIKQGIIHNPHYYEYMAQLNRDGVMNIQIGENDPCSEELNKALREMSKSEAYMKATKRNITTGAIENFIPRVLNEMSIILPLLVNDVHDDETFRHKKQDLRELYLIQKQKGMQRAEVNWTNQLRLMHKRRELKKDLIKIIEMFERGLKDFIIMGHAEQDYDTMFDNIGHLITYFRTQLIENEKRHNLKNKTTISIDHGLQCRLVIY